MLLIRNAELASRRVDVRCTEGAIAEIGANLHPLPEEQVLDAAGGALLPGLHDHHIHLFALAAARRSVPCGPPETNSRTELFERLRNLPGTGWVRGVGYHEAVAGALDREQLDRMVPNRPVRIQHRSGKAWLLNSAACEALGLDRQQIEGIERGADGRPTGRLFRLDAWLRERVRRVVPDLATLSAELAAYGVTGVTDTTATNGAEEMSAFETLLERGGLHQNVIVMGGADLPLGGHPQLHRGALKVLLDEDTLPPIADLEAQIDTAHAAGRPVAIHCVTEVELMMALSALAASGPADGDRIEHASLTPPHAIPVIKETGVTVVTQPALVHDRGDQYLTDVDPAEHAWLYRLAGLRQHGIPVAGSSDAPFGSADPWVAMRAAVDRRTRAGHRLGPAEALSPEQALALFLGPLEKPGGPPRRIVAGAPADLCLLTPSWREARERLRAEDVRLTCRAGRVIFDRDG